MFTYISMIFVINECKYTNPMDPMGTYTYHLAIPQPEKPSRLVSTPRLSRSTALGPGTSFSPKVWGEKPEQNAGSFTTYPVILRILGFQMAPHLGLKKNESPLATLIAISSYCIKQLTLNE